MSLQEQIAEAIIIAFDELGGDPLKAVESAQRHADIESWVQQETTKIAFAGGAEMAIPGLHALTIPAGISYLLHKMAIIGWGIGAIKGAHIIETPQHSDLRNILTLWGNSSYYNPHLLEHVAVDRALFETCLTDDGLKTLETAIETAQTAEREPVYIQTLMMMHNLASGFASDEAAAQLLRLESKYHTETERLINQARPRATQFETNVSAPPDSRISAKLAGRLAARISMRIPARFVMGFVPFAGALVNAFFNAQTLRSYADTAEKYYDRRLMSLDS